MITFNGIEEDFMNSNTTSTSAALVAAVDSFWDFLSTDASSASNMTLTTTSASTYYYPKIGTAVSNTVWTCPSTINNWYVHLADNWKYQDSVSEKDYPNYPVCDHYVEEDGSHTLEFALPRFTRKELGIKIDDDKLIISGTHSDDNKGNEKKRICLHKKIGGRDFKLSYKVPEKLDITKTTSSFNEGILTINIPLCEELKKRNKEVTIG